MCIKYMWVMEQNKNIPFESLAVECEIFNPSDVKKTIDNISALSARFPNEYLILIYNYLFQNTDCFEVMIFLLKKTDKFKDKSSRAFLTDYLVIKEKLLNQLQDSEKATRIRIEITKVLANTKDLQAVYPLLYCLNSKDENYKVKIACAEALGKIGDKYAVLPLMNVVEDEEENSVYVKESAVSALGMIGDEKAVDSLVSILESKKGFLDKFTFLKERALEALNKLNFKNDKVYHALEKSLRDESIQVRINAIEVLMNMDEERAEKLIISMLEDRNTEVVQNAVIALYNIKGEEYLDKLIDDKNSPANARIQAVKLRDELQKEEEDEEDFFDDE